MSWSIGLISVGMSPFSFFTQGRAVRWLYSASSSWPSCGLRAERPSAYWTVGLTPDNQVRPKKQAWSGLGSRARHLWMLYWLLGKLITCLEESEMCLASDHVVIVRVHWHRRGLRHVHHRPDDSDLPRHLHGIQREPTDPQPRPGHPQLSWDAGHVRGAAGGEIQLSHQRRKRLRE